jgi:glycosyltransferase involved in cell wall biosynthesis
MLTVVLPNFNHARFLPNALDALMAQTRSADELIIMDDASTDDSVSVIKPYVKRHPNLRLVRNEKNQGAIRNMNDGLVLARGTLVLFAAADDVVYPSLLEVAIQLLDSYPQAALFSARSDLIDIEGRRTGTVPTPIPLSSPGFLDSAAVSHHLLRDDGWFMGNCTIYRRASLLAVNGFPEDLGAFTDGYVSRLLALTHGACFSPEVLGAWRRTEGGLAWSQSASVEKARELISVAENKMRATGVFSPKYMERWKRRHMFGVLRFALEHSQRPNESSDFLLQSVRRRILMLLWFVNLRPWDVFTVLRRRLALLLYRFSPNFRMSRGRKKN